MSDTDTITLAHGAGGRQTAALIDNVFARHFRNPEFTSDDAAILPLGNTRAAFTTDASSSRPGVSRVATSASSASAARSTTSLHGCRAPLSLLCLPDRGRLCHGRPQGIAAAMAKTAAEAGVRIVAGDTKVAGRGQVDHIFITTTGIGEVLPGAEPSGSRARPGDAVIVTGDIGRHGCAILLAREDFGIEAEVTSDCAPLSGMVRQLFDAVADRKAIHTVRDATRGGVGTVLYEIARESRVGVHLKAAAIPVQPAVKGVCGMLGLEPCISPAKGVS